MPQQSTVSVCVQAHDAKMMNYPWLRNIHGGLSYILYKEPADTGSWKMYTEDIWKLHCKNVDHDMNLVDAHYDAFINPETRFAKLMFVFKDGTKMEPIIEFYELEADWFDENMPLQSNTNGNNMYNYNQSNTNAYNMPTNKPYMMISDFMKKGCPSCEASSKGHHDNYKNMTYNTQNSQMDRSSMYVNPAQQFYQNPMKQSNGQLNMQSSTQNGQGIKPQMNKAMDQLQKKDKFAHNQYGQHMYPTSRAQQPYMKPEMAQYQNTNKYMVQSNVQQGNGLHYLKPTLNNKDVEEYDEDEHDE